MSIFTTTTTTRHHQRKFLRFLLISIIARGSIITSAKPTAAFQSQQCTTTKRQSSSDLSPDEWIIMWVEDTSAPPLTISPSFLEDEEQEDPFANWYAKPKRKVFWMGRMEEGSYHPSYRCPRRHPPTIRPSPHPLRMEQWNITLAWREHKRDRDAALSFEFNENGYVRCPHPNRPEQRSHNQKQRWTDRIARQLLHNTEDGDKTSEPDNLTTFIAGTWKLAPSGVTWKMTWDGNTYLFFADLHSNPFGRHPKMFRGMVIRDRTIAYPALRRLFRPLVATFTGIGAGTDTADFTYQNRGKLGYASPQVQPGH